MVKLLAGENPDLAEHIENCTRRENGNRSGNQPTFLTHYFVNKSLFVIRKVLISEIVGEINKNGGMFGLLMDATQDITCKEQFSVVARYVSDTDDVEERTVAFFESADTSGEALFDTMKAKLSEIGLTISKIVGCSFDGATNMSSPDIGLRAFIQRNCKESLYTWRMSHRFNLVMKKAIKGSAHVTFILQIAETSAKLFRSSYVRMNIWTNVLKTTPNINSQRKLKLIGTTRWSSAQDAVNSIISTDTK